MPGAPGWAIKAYYAIAAWWFISGAYRVMAATVLAAGQAARSLAQPPRFPEEFLRDAELTDVFFVDPDRGWAVGDRGVIWHTDDGGRNWQLQSSPVPCRLESVSFVDDRNGWIVGGWSHRYTHRSTGVVLRTTDGGQYWEQIPRVSLPALRRVEFFDLRTGRSWGEPQRVKTRHYDAALADGRELVQGPYQAELLDVTTDETYVVIET